MKNIKLLTTSSQRKKKIILELISIHIRKKKVFVVYNRYVHNHPCIPQMHFITASVQMSSVVISVWIYFINFQVESNNFNLFCFKPSTCNVFTYRKVSWQVLANCSFLFTIPNKHINSKFKEENPLTLIRKEIFL